MKTKSKSKDKEEIVSEEEYEEKIQKKIQSILHFYNKSKSKADLDFILKRFNMKCMKNNKKSSPMTLKMDIKHKIIIMSIHEPEDIFDYDYFIHHNQKNKSIKI